MALALFDLDNTLLAGDSDHLWGEFLSQRGLVNGAEFQATNDKFYQDYVAGTLDVHAYLRFVLAPIAGRDLAELARWHADFMTHFIEPIIPTAALDLVARHRQAGDTLVIITATNDFITGPIAKRFAIGTLIASRAEMQNGHYTGQVTGIPCFREGKVKNLEDWLTTHPHDLHDAYFYSDSFNDLPLLSKVGHPVAVDADARLTAHAQANHWPFLSLRG